MMPPGKCLASCSAQHRGADAIQVALAGSRLVQRQQRRSASRCQSGDVVLAAPRRSRRAGWRGRDGRPRRRCCRSPAPARTRRRTACRSISPVRATLPFSAPVVAPGQLLVAADRSCQPSETPTKPAERFSHGAEQASARAVPVALGEEHRHALVVADPGRCCRRRGCPGAAPAARRGGSRASVPCSGTKRVRCSTTRGCGSAMISFSMR